MRTINFHRAYLQCSLSVIVLPLGGTICDNVSYKVEELATIGLPHDLAIRPN